jgi:hypothetical protein
VSAFDTIPEERESTPQRSRRPLILALVLLIVIAGAAGWWFLTGDDDLEALDVAAPAVPSAVDAVDAVDADVTAVEGDVQLAALPAATYEIFLSRDPFEPVVPEDVPTASDGAATPVSDSGNTTDPDDDNGATEPTDSDATDPDPAGSGCTRQGEVVCDGRVVSLVDVTTDADGESVAAVQVDTTIYEVVPGQTFAGSFQLRAIDGQCVSMLHGDDGFQLCTGDRVLK